MKSTSVVATPKPVPQVPPTGPKKTVQDTALQVTGTSDAFVRASNELGMHLYRVNQKKPGNMVFSPASISLAFTMTYAGANGATADEMAATLHLGDNASVHTSASAFLAGWREEGAEELTIVNRLFGQSGYNFEAPFLATTKELYLAPLETLDFVSNPDKQRLHINKWVMEQTADKIEELLPKGALDAMTRLVLVNAVHFLGKWSSAFPKKNTKSLPFWVDGKSKTKLPTMALTHDFAFSKVKGAKVLQLPYEGSDLAMTLILPDKRGGLSGLESQLSTATLSGWLSGLSTKKVSVELPRFELKNARIPLKDSMKKLGMKLAFDSSAADFSKMRNSGPDDRLYIAKAFHEAFVKVDESGTEAAAATAVVMATRGGRPPPEKIANFHVDRPFLFTISDTSSGAILFLGRVVDPR
ncbi:MAG: serpin family protein [Kofleriaceae bacterium]|nr:serpin family protein [Kofleriaceae bacterium]